MKRNVFWSLAMAGGLFFISGCKEKPAEQAPTNLVPVNEGVVAPLSNMPPAQIGETQPHAQTPQAVRAPAVQRLQPMETISDVSSLSEKDIQQALKNAGFYEGEVDGKIGPKSKKATEDFQEKNGLKVDGKVGPLTWENLKAYLTASPEPSPAEIKN